MLKIPSQSNKLWTHGLLILGLCIAGGNFIAVKQVVNHAMTPVQFVMVRVTITAIFFTIVSLFIPENKKITLNDHIRLFSCAVCGVAVNQYFFYAGMQLTSPINASIFNLMLPVTIAVLSYFWLKQPMNNYILAGLMFSLAGAAVLIDFAKVSFSQSTFWGDLFVLINAIFFGIYLIGIVPLAQKYHAVTITKWLFVYGFIIFLPIGGAEALQSDFSQFTDNDWYAFIFVIVFTSWIAYFLNNYMPKIASTYLIGVYVYAQPFVTTLFSLILGKDELTIKKVICGLIIIFGIYLVQYGRAKQ
ncbi:MAG: DMT family transporter [Cytophagales bacterium]|nr:DMT family transporter [Cytophagales bacterium]